MVSGALRRILDSDEQDAERGGATGEFCPGPHSAYGPQKDQYTLIEQSNTLLKQSLHIFCPGPLKHS